MYSIKNTSKTASRVVYDVKNRMLRVGPMETVSADLHPKLVSRLRGGVLEVTETPGANGSGGEVVSFREEVTAESLADMAEAGQVAFFKLKAQAKSFLGDNVPAKKVDIISALRDEHARRGH